MLSAPGWVVHSHAAEEESVYELTVQDQPLNLVMESLLWQALETTVELSAIGGARHREICSKKLKPPGGNPRRRPRQALSVLIPHSDSGRPPLSDLFVLSMVTHLAVEIAQRGFAMLLHTVPPPMSDWIADLIRSHRSDGIIAVGQGTEARALERLARTHRPLVIWGEPLEDPSCCTVGIDNVTGARSAVEHLLQIGRRRIVFLAHDSETAEARLRYEGYRHALEVAPLGTAPPRVISSDLVAGTGHAESEFGGKGSAFDAVFAASDITAMRLLRSLAASGLRVPEDVAVVGFGDIPLAEHWNPTLTTVRQDAREGARMLVELLLRRLVGEDTGSIVLPATVIVRESSAGRSVGGGFRVPAESRGP